MIFSVLIGDHCWKNDTSGIWATSWIRCSGCFSDLSSGCLWIANLQRTLHAKMYDFNNSIIEATVICNKKIRFNIKYNYHSMYLWSKIMQWSSPTSRSCRTFASLCKMTCWFYAWFLVADIFAAIGWHIEIIICAFQCSTLI